MGQQGRHKVSCHECDQLSLNCRPGKTSSIAPIISGAAPKFVLECVTPTKAPSEKER